MDWKELQESTKAITGLAAQKINEMSDLASLHLKLKTSEYRLRLLHEELGKPPLSISPPKTVGWNGSKNLWKPSPWSKKPSQI